jgi:hypothetical protein
VKRIFFSKNTFHIMWREQKNLNAVFTAGEAPKNFKRNQINCYLLIPPAVRFIQTWRLPTTELLDMVRTWYGHGAEEYARKCRDARRASPPHNKTGGHLSGDARRASLHNPTCFPKQQRFSPSCRKRQNDEKHKQHET